MENVWGNCGRLNGGPRSSVWCCSGKRTMSRRRRLPLKLNLEVRMVELDYTRIISDSG